MELSAYQSHLSQVFDKLEPILQLAIKSHEPVQLRITGSLISSLKQNFTNDILTSSAL